jgi:hypothetical protein
MRQEQLLGKQHDFVCEGRFPQGRCGCGQPFGQIDFGCLRGQGFTPGSGPA